MIEKVYLYSNEGNSIISVGEEEKTKTLFILINKKGFN